MAKKELTLVVRARNAVAAGFSSVARSVKSFGSVIGGISGAASNLLKRVGLSFAGIATGIGLAMRKAEEFTKQIDQVRTLSTFTTSEASRGVRKLAAEFGLAKEELTKGLYDALSAGVPTENAFEFLRTAAKMARAGAASTAESVDLLTTALNSYGIPAEKATAVSDLLFTTVRLGKTSVAGLAASFAQVAPLAASSGVEIDQLLSAVASLTKQGTKTPEAMTKIRAAIVAMNRELGDGWANSMSLQEGFEAMTRKANGSTQALTKMSGSIEGALAIMALTGDKSKAAAADIAEFSKAGGETGRAFDKVASSNVLQRFGSAINNIVITAGYAALKILGPTIERAATAAASFAEKIADWAGTSETITKIRDNIDGIVNAMGSEEGRGEVAAAVGDVLKAAWAVAAENAVTLLKNAAPEIGRLIGSAAKAGMKKVPLWIHTPQSEIDAAMKQLGISYPEKSATKKFTEAFLQIPIPTPEKMGYSGPPKELRDSYPEKSATKKFTEAFLQIPIPTPEKMGYSGLPKELREAIKARILLNRETGKGIEKTESQIEAENRLSVALKNLSAIAAKYANSDFVSPPAPPAPPADETTTLLGGTPPPPPPPPPDDELLAEREKLLAEKKALEEEYAAVKKAALEDRWKAQKDADEKELALAEELAGKKIAAFIQENKEKAKAEKQTARDAENEAKRAAMLEDRVRKGGRLSKRQWEWLDAFRAIQGAQAQLQPLRDQIKGAEDRLAQLQQTNRTLGEIKKGLDQNKVALNALMKLG